MLKVLIADKLAEVARTRLQEGDCEVLQDPSLKDDTLVAALREHDPEVLVVRSTKVRAEHFEAASSLALVVRAGAGVNTIDLATASSRGVFVSNCPGTNSVAVAELTWGHILNADRRIADGVADLRAGDWRKKTYSQAHGVYGRTLGLLGMGAIAREVAKRARSFGMPVVAWSRSLTDEDAAELGIRRMDSAVEVAKRADVLSVHLASTPATRRFVGPAIFDALPNGAIFVNTSRGEVVDEDALVKAVTERGIKAGLDVFCGEPAVDGPWSTPVADLDGVYGTHHIGASTTQAQESVAAEACRVVLAFAATGDAPNCVNLAGRTPATHLMVVRHVDEVGVLARILDLLRHAGINVAKMQNIIFAGTDGGAGGAACARIQLEGEPPDSVLDLLRRADPIFDVKLVSLEDA